MNSSGPLACIQCGTVLSTTGGRCPSCGAIQPDAPPPRRRPEVLGPGVYSPSLIKRKKPTPWAALIGIGVGVALLGGVGLVALRTLGNPPPPPPPAAPPPTPPPSASADPMHPDYADELAAAERRARGWDRDAQLVSISVSAVRETGPALDRGSVLVFRYAKPSQGFGPDSPVGGARFVVTRDKSGLKVDDSARDKPGRAVPIPTCTLLAAWRTVVASGVPSTHPIDLEYVYSEKHSRPVWNTDNSQRPELARTLDGKNCAILRR